MARKNIALLTSTIAPAAGVLHLKRRNVEERLSDYRRALTFYCECLRRDIFDQLVYADNSGYPLDSLRALAELEGMSSRVEFISYKSTVPPDTGRLYQELNLVFKALNAATLLQGDVTIWKITGRYIVKNVAAIVSGCAGADFCVNCRNYPKPWADFYIAGFTRYAFDAVFGEQLETYRSPHWGGEETLRKTFDTDYPAVNMVRRFTVIPRIEGVRGFDGTRYEGWKNLYKFYFRAVLNSVLPSLWV